jgi:pimeloyl-ACP methyl ester carboxylesterase
VDHLAFHQRAVLAAFVALALCSCSSEDGGNESTGAPIEGAGSGGTGAAAGAGGGAGPAGSAGTAGGSSEPAGPIQGMDKVGVNEAGVDSLPPLPGDVTLPIVFAHGFAGSAQQYESQAIRFAANGYPQERIKAYDHDGAGFDIGGYVAGLDAVINAALEEFGVTQVYLVGHSRGTSVSSMYLEGDPARAAKVAKYIAIDGRPCPTVVPCIAPNQAGIPGQAHVEVATSKESFAMQYEFLVGQAPQVVEIVAQREPVVISGRAVNFPANTGRADTTLDIWEIDSATGMRVGSAPHATFAIAADGEWGPAAVDSRKHYEFALSGAATNSHHLYPQRFLRNSRFVRLLSGGPDSASRMNSNLGDSHANIVAIRMREWYAMDDADLEGNESDVLEISVTSAAGTAEKVNAITADVGNGAIGIHIHDAADSPGDTTLAPLANFHMQAFQAGVDVFLPGADPANGTITITNLPRGDAQRPQTLNVPNWSSLNHAISVVFTDFPVD